ncbi:MAG: hypothetical protein IPJ12_03030 [Betaproteobacteria bacterium]|jgi:uncharacterized membrane protein YvbJ|nr:hypothetical protein [Betaproteobacteria bacterium]
MYCEKCGADNLETSLRCIQCGSDLVANFNKSTSPSVELPNTPDSSNEKHPSPMRVGLAWLSAIAVSIVTALSVGAVPRTVGQWVGLALFGPILLMAIDMLFSSKSKK